MIEIEENSKYKKKYYLQYIEFVLFINVIFLLSFGIYNYKKSFSPYDPKIKEIKIGDGKSAKIGIISDFQLRKHYENISFKYYSDNVYRALKAFKKLNVDIIIIAGDITNDGKVINYLYFKEIYYSIFENNKKPILISLMGNHDYNDKNYTKLGNQEKFYNFINEYPFSHYIINNYNFIFWSNNHIKNEKSEKEENSWIKSRLEIARKNKKRVGDPIFVISHMPPLKTVYGSENIWGNKYVYKILKNYPEAISISGHSHYSLRNIKSIWQGEFTAINIQSISYVDLDKFYINYKDVRFESAKEDSMGLIVYLNEKNVIFDRIKFFDEEIMEERWNLNFPLYVSNFKYKFEKMNKKIKPVFDKKNKIEIQKINMNNKNITFIIFNAALHEDYVYRYKVCLKSKENPKNNKIFYYYSDYYKNKKFRKKILKFELPKDINEDKYNIYIYAMDSFDNISDPIKGIINI